MNRELAEAILASAGRIGADPLDLATVVSFETGGTFNPEIWGGAGNRHFGLIQAGPEERERYGIKPGQPLSDHMAGVERYLTDRGFRPGMGMLDLYSTINAGRPGLYNRSDAANGGTPGTVADKVATQMGGHRAKAAALLGLPAGTPAAAPMAASVPSMALPMGGNSASDVEPSIMQALQAIARSAQTEDEPEEFGSLRIDFPTPPGIARQRLALRQRMRG